MRTNSGKSSRREYNTVIMDDGQVLERVKYDFSVTRRSFVQLGAGIVIATGVSSLVAQQRGRGGDGAEGGGAVGAANLDARLHIAKDGVITVMTGKVEAGQGARAEITQAAAEELRAPISQIRLIMADSELCPDDGPTYGSMTTPRTLPMIRSDCAAARHVLIALAARQWNLTADGVTLRDGVAIDVSGRRKLTYGDLASSDDLFKGPIPPNVLVSPVSDWKVMGIPTPRPNAHDLVNGAYRYPSAIARPGMLHGKVLRAPAYGAKLRSVDVSAAKSMSGVVVIQDGDFVGVAAPTTHQAKKAVESIAKTAQWDRAPHHSSQDLPKYLRENTRGGMPANPFIDDVRSAAKTLKASYDVAYAQHAPMEPRAAVAEWNDGRVTVWTASQVPAGVKGELATALRISADKVRVIIPDFGGAFGGKHTGECAVEAARLSKAARKPVSLCWTREEEFTWAAFRSAAAIDIEATLDAKGTITSWYHVAIQGANAAPDTPYRVAHARSVNPTSDQPLRLAAYRALGSTANMFARESFMDELAAAAGKDRLEFRLAHLDDPRLRAVLEDAAKRFDWASRSARRQPNIGVGLACGTEKGSFVAACVEVAVDPQDKRIRIRRVCETFECGAIVNPMNLLSQVQGAIIQGIGPALREAMEFKDGVMLNPSFSTYKVPRFVDLPELEINLLNRPDLPSVGAGETPLIALAPAVANAVYAATATRVRHMPIKLTRA